jgi:hypothetical protein
MRRLAQELGGIRLVSAFPLRTGEIEGETGSFECGFDAAKLQVGLAKKAERERVAKLRTSFSLVDRASGVPYSIGPASATCASPT